MRKQEIDRVLLVKCRPVGCRKETQEAARNRCGMIAILCISCGYPIVQLTGSFLRIEGINELATLR